MGRVGGPWTLAQNGQQAVNHSGTARSPHVATHHNLVLMRRQAIKERARAWRRQRRQQTAMSSRSRDMPTGGATTRNAVAILRATTWARWCARAEDAA